MLRPTSWNVSTGRAPGRGHARTREGGPFYRGFGQAAGRGSSDAATRPVERAGNQVDQRGGKSMADILDLAGRVALVTGAGQGIGRQIALHLSGHNSGGVAVNDYYLDRAEAVRSEEHTSELQSLMRISYAVFC